MSSLSNSRSGRRVGRGPICGGTPAPPQADQLLCSVELDHFPVGIALHLVPLPQPGSDVECQHIGIELQNRITHFACRLPEELQPSFEQLDIEPRQRHMLGHGSPAEMARSAQFHRPEIDHLHKMRIPVRNMRFEYGTQRGVLSGPGVKRMNQLRNFLLGTEVGVGSYEL